MNSSKIRNNFILTCSEERNSGNSFHEANISLIPKLNKDIRRKLWANISHEHMCRNSIQSNSKSNPVKLKIKSLRHYGQAGFTSERKGWFDI